MIEAVLLGIALAMDSLAMSIVNGIRYQNYGRKEMIISSFSFGFFQGLMPLLGYLVFLPIISYIEKIDHWVVLIVLSFLGISMIRDSFEDEEISEKSEVFTYRILLMESIATSIDALSTGIVLPTLTIDPLLTCLIIFLCTFLICLLGHAFGKQIGLYLKNKATILGGVILILIGIRTVLEHLGMI